MTIPDSAFAKDCDLYADDILSELTQCAEEGLDTKDVEPIFRAAAALERGRLRSEISDALFRWTQKAPSVPGYPYTEPSALPDILALRKPFVLSDARNPSDNALEDKIRGAWFGRICGCLLGKPLEGIRSEELISFLKATGNYPMHRYPLARELSDEICSSFRFHFSGKPYADTIDCAPADDDTNYTVLAQIVIDQYGRNFTGEDILGCWFRLQPANAYFTAEQAAYRNRTSGLLPPYTATYKNPFREWIGAQIRGDYFGYICPGDPEQAAALAFRDAQISHVKNGIYGEMFVAAMLAAAGVTADIQQILRCGLAQIPATSRLYARVSQVLDGYLSGVPAEDCIRQIHLLYDEHTGYGWCHTIPNAMIVSAALLYGNGDFGRSICMAVQAAFDTDCNGATVGSVLGMANGAEAIDPVWTSPLHGRLRTEICNTGTTEIETLVQKTIKHIKEVKP